MELKLSKILIAAGHFRNPQPTSRIIELANELINTPEHLHELILWREKHQPNYSSDTKLTYQWYAGFKSRFRDVLVSAKPHGMSNSKNTWCTYLNFRVMYDDIYSCLVENKLAVEIEEAVYVDIHGNKCTKKEAFGKKITHQFVHPEMCIVFDETGGDTSQEKDGKRSLSLQEEPHYHFL